MQEVDNDGPLAQVRELFTKPRSVPDDEYVDLDTIELEDLAFVAKRLIVKMVQTLDFTELADLAGALFDEDDVSTVRRFIHNAKVRVEIPGYDCE